MDLGIRPMAFSTNPDGSTKWIFVQLSDFNGFAVVDFATHKEIQRINNPDLAPGKTAVHYGGKASHGMAVTADGKTAYVANAASNSVSVVDIKTMKETMRIPVGEVPKRNITAVFP